ncbi:hypothetical protein HPB49_001203 [Dermacentor silvarum]|uniref:Uncharacterized protein n=1 Tax=Dermacentor silvarum TaxID=543639 RepID=A0ACB8CUH1_DERSI|nr:hypothetical protein HPB49_001203 [Dermacentor silvarum]
MLNTPTSAASPNFSSRGSPRSATRTTESVAPSNGVNTLPGPLVPSDGGSIRLAESESFQEALRAITEHFIEISELRRFGKTGLLWVPTNITPEALKMLYSAGIVSVYRCNRSVVDRTRKKGKDRASYRGGIMAELVERGKKRQREEEKEEQAADAATERELKRRQDAMTLEEIREQVQEAEKKLAALVAERLQLFMQLEKVLREEEAQKRALEKEANN